MLEELQRLYRLLQEEEREILKEALREAASALGGDEGELRYIVAEA